MQYKSELTCYAQLQEQFSRNVGTLLDNAYQLSSHKAALISPERTLSYEELYFYVHLAARLFKKNGVSAGDRVVIYAHNSLEFYAAYLAAWQLGAVAVPLNIYFHTKELQTVLSDATPQLIVTVSSLHEKLAAAGVSSSPVLQLDTVLWQEDFSQEKLAVFLKNSRPYRYTKNQLALILYTSGTTGVPKGVMLSSGNIMTNGLQVLARFITHVGTDADERFFSLLPLFHVFAQNTCVWLPLLLGASIIVVPKIDRKAIRHGLTHKPTMFFGFPALYGLLVMMKTAPLDSIKLFVSGADALPDKIRAAFSLVYGRKIASGYGLTEASPVIGAYIENSETETSNIGLPLSGITCQIRGEDGKKLPDGEVGTLWVKGDNVMLGYYNAPEQTAQVLVKGWLNTGDLAAIAPDGTIVISGRSKDLIINKGFNIYPQEVENILLRHPAVFKAAVLGKKDGDHGEVPVAFVAIREGYTADQAVLKQFCKENLAAYKIPRTIACQTDLPMTATGKIDKKQLNL